MTVNVKKLAWAVAIGWLSQSSLVQAATTTLYAMNSSFTTPYIYVLPTTTMAVTSTLTNLSSTNGRGVAIVGNTLYYTTSVSNSVYSYSIGSQTDNGALFAVAGSSGLSALAFDGTNLWIADAGTNHAFQYSLTGTLLKTVTLASASPGISGLEYFLQNGQGRLIANEGSVNGTYDIYDTNGTLITPGFISTGGPASGIAFDGTNFWVARIFAQSIEAYRGTTGALVSGSTLAVTNYPSGKAPLLEDLSFDYNAVLPPPTGPSVPALSSWGLAACCVLLLAAGVLASRARAN
jgi:hypothetical protein